MKYTRTQKVVLAHDWLVGYRGGERVLEAIAELFPEAPIYTLIHAKGSTSPGLEAKRVRTSWMNWIPGVHRFYRHLLPIMPFAAKTLKIDSGDLVISSHHCVIKSVQIPKNAKHICYVHSPMRYLYDQYDVYFGPNAKFHHRLVMGLIRPWLTNWDQRSHQSVDCFLANSHFVQKRIQKYYAIEAQVVHPFVEWEAIEAAKAKFDKQNPGYQRSGYLILSAFAPNKRIDLAIQACEELGVPLRIIGSGQDEERLKTLAAGNTIFLGSVDREQVLEELIKCKALLFPGVEDFGITPLEALAAGAPVIAFQEGGVLETLDSSVAHFFSEPSAANLKSAIQEFETRIFDLTTLQARARQFGKKQFQDKLLAAIDQVLSKQTRRDVL